MEAFVHPNSVAPEFGADLAGGQLPDNAFVHVQNTQEAFQSDEEEEDEPYDFVYESEDGGEPFVPTAAEADKQEATRFCHLKHGLKHSASTN